MKVATPTVVRASCDCLLPEQDDLPDTIFVAQRNSSQQVSALLMDESLSHISGSGCAPLLDDLPPFRPSRKGSLTHAPKGVAADEVPENDSSGDFAPSKPSRRGSLAGCGSSSQCSEADSVDNSSNSRDSAPCRPRRRGSMAAEGVTTADVVVNDSNNDMNQAPCRPTRRGSLLGALRSSIKLRSDHGNDDSTPFQPARKESLSDVRASLSSAATFRASITSSFRASNTSGATFRSSLSSAAGSFLKWKQQVRRTTTTVIDSVPSPPCRTGSMLGETPAQESSEEQTTETIISSATGTPLTSAPVATPGRLSPRTKNTQRTPFRRILPGIRLPARRRQPSAASA